MYQLTLSDSIFRISDNAYIPPDPLNRDYAEYLEWLSQGNEPLPAFYPPDYNAFWQELVNSSIYSSIREQSFTNLILNTLVTEFIVLIMDAKMGIINENLIQQSINSILSVGTFTQENLNDLQNCLNVGHMEEIYTIPNN